MYNGLRCIGFNYWGKKCIRKCRSYFIIFSGGEEKSYTFEKILSVMYVYYLINV